MKLIKKFLGIAAIIAVIGFSFIACDDLSNLFKGTDDKNGGESSNGKNSGDNSGDNGEDIFKISDYEEYPLDKGYNVWGKQDSQKGWAIGGIKFEGKDDEIKTAEDVGYDIEKFQKATKLMIEMPDDSYPKGRISIIWGGEDANGDSTIAGGTWNQLQIARGKIIEAKYAKQDNNVLIIDLKTALNGYYIYKAPTTKKLKIILQVSGTGGVEGLVQKATLLIPKTSPFVGVSDISLTSNTMYWKDELVLDTKITPSNATNQSVIWVIKSFSPMGGSVISLPALDPFDSASVAAYEVAKNERLEGKVGWKQEKYTYYDDTVNPPEYKYRDIPIIVVPDGAESVGTLKVLALIKQGQKDNNGNLMDFTKEFIITIEKPPMFSYKIDGTLYGTFQWGAVDNNGVSGGTMDVITKDKNGNNLPGVTVNGGTGYTSYDILYSPTGGQYGNSAHYIEITFPEEKRFRDYNIVKCHYTSENCDLTGKSVRLKAMATKPPRTYNPGPYIATTSFDSSVPDGKDTDLTFELSKDNASNADGTTKQGIYDKGVGADLTLAETNQDNAYRFFTKDEYGNTMFLGNENKVYIWILPWADKGAKFTISDIEFLSSN